MGAKKLKHHPAANVFPMMDDERMQELQEDIRKYGQMEPITICDGKILDGRNRYAACLALGAKPTTRVHHGDPWLFAWSLNGARRDLIQTVRVLLYLDCVKGSKKWNETQSKIIDEAQQKRVESAARRERSENGVFKPLAGTDYLRVAKGGRNVTREAVAKELGVSDSLVKNANQIEKRPDLKQKVVSGEITPAQALKEIRGTTSKPTAKSCVPAFEKIWANASKKDRQAIRKIVLNKS